MKAIPNYSQAFEGIACWCKKKIQQNQLLLHLDVL